MERDRLTQEAALAMILCVATRAGGRIATRVAGNNERSGIPLFAGKS